MFKLQRFASLMTKRPSYFNQFVAQNQFVLNQLKYNRTSVNCEQSNRHFAKKPDDCKLVRPAECKPKEKKECKPPAQKDSIKKPLPYLQECAKPNLMSECPKPQCAQEPQKSDPKNILLVAMLALAATLGALFFYFQPPSQKDQDKDKPKKPPKATKPSKVVKKPRVIVKDPATSKEIPKEIPYLIIGGGTAGFTAFRAIKSNDPTAKVLIISNEDQYPYMRPPLSKEVWFSNDPETPKTLNFSQWSGAPRSVFYEPPEFYLKTRDVVASENGGAAIAKGWSVSRIDVENRKAILEDGTEITYEKCLIATGSLPKSLEVFEGASEDVLDKTALFRTIQDFQCLYERLESAKSVAIIGGGFLGSELACALAQRIKKNPDFKVYQIFKEAGHMGGVLPEYLSFWTTDKIKADGVNVMPFTEVMSATANEQTITLNLSGNKNITTDVVIVAVGSEPNTELAATSNLEVDPEIGGYLVNSELQARSNLYVAGDAACFYDPHLGRRRIEHHDNAIISGRLAGENMTGASKSYMHQSMFWSDLGPDVGYEAIGIVHSSLPTVGVFAKVTKTTSSVAELPKVEEVPDQCVKFLSKEEEEKLKQAKSALEQRKKESEERKKQLAQMPSDDFNKGIIFYLRDDIVVGIVLWNVYNRLSIARQVLMEQRKYEDLNEVAKLFNIHEE